MEANKMDRGTEALRTHMDGCEKMSIRQTKKGWFQELIGCEAQSEFRFFTDPEGQPVFTGKDDGTFVCRFCCSPCYPYDMVVKENNTDAEVVTISRPFNCSPGACKCCCYQESTFTSGGTLLGTIKETFYFCVPTFKVADHEGKDLYIVHPPTCMGGVCVNCCAEGNPCGKGCCRVSFRFFPADQADTDGDAPYDGMILKKPKSLATELFTDANAFDVDFPQNASAAVKGIVMGTTIFLNSNFFEGNNGE